jgi:uncharacterized protein YcnI
MHSSRRVIRRVLPLLVAAPILLVTVPASAHVEVASTNAAAGAKNVTLTFHIPNELAPLTTVGIRILLPTDHPLIGVTTGTQHGFASNVQVTHLATPVNGPAGPVSDVASEIDFSGGNITGTQELAFKVSVQQLPRDVQALTFKTLQNYSSGQTVSWVEVAASGAPEPEHPAPVLKLSGASVAQPGVNVAAAKGGSPGGPSTAVLAGIAAAALLAIGAGAWARQRARRDAPTAELDDLDEPEDARL